MNAQSRAPKVRAGMVGGGPGAFIGAVHRSATRLDDEIELVCGAFSSNADKSQAMGSELRLHDSRVYASYEQMMRAERALPADERMQFVIVATPNHLHFPVAACALRHGFHVMCDKPVTFDLREALQLRDIIAREGRLFGLTYTYSGYPMVEQARALIANGALGALRNVQVEYLQGWLSESPEASGNVQAQWRVDPQRAGAGGALGDLGVHALHLAEYVSHLRVSALCADLASFGAGRTLDDDGCILVRFDSGARGQIACSQICVGELNGLKLRIYGERGSLEWDHRTPDRLVVRLLDQPTQIYHAGQGMPYLASGVHQRLPSGHPEGYIEAFANLYRNFAIAVRDEAARADVPGIDEGIRGMTFIEQSVASHRAASKWLPLTPPAA